jgi:hypothetical protein
MNARQRNRSRNLQAAAQAAVLAVVAALAPGAHAAAGPGANVTFEDVPWGATRRAVRAQLASRGFTLFASTPDDFYRGTFDANGVTVESVFAPDDELVFVRVIFDRQSDAAQILGALHREYGKAASCDARVIRCRWERGTSEVTLTGAGDPYAPPGQASLEYSAGGSLAARYAEQVNGTERDNDRSGMGSRHVP